MSSLPTKKRPRIAQTTQSKVFFFSSGKTRSRSLENKPHAQRDLGTRIWKDDGKDECMNKAFNTLKVAVLKYSP